MPSLTPKSYARRSLLAIYLTLMLLTLLVFVSIGGFLLSQQKNQLERSFLQQAHQAEQNLQQTFAANETILDGFAAYIASEGAVHEEGLRRYAQTMLANYPHLYMFQVANRINGLQIARLEAVMSHRNMPFEVWYFDGEISYARDSTEKNKYFFPIVFAEPVFRSDISVLGLDIQSISFVRDALQNSQQSGQIALSHPFELFEGDDALVMIKPSVLHGQKDAPYYALAVIKVSALLQSIAEFDPHSSLFLRNNDQENILSRAAMASSAYAVPLTLVFSHVMQVAGKELHLEIRRELRLEDFDFLVSWVLMLVGLLIVGVLYVLMRTHLAVERQKERDKVNLYRKANYDELTGLANRHYFQDQVKLAFAAARRRGGKVGFMYLDLNDFKTINDRLGHNIGDKVLMIFAGMILDVIRSEDIAARLGGDEFVIMLNNIRDVQDMQHVSLELRARCALVQEVDGHPVQLKTSIGVVIFPDQGETLDILLHAADSAMYADKELHKAAR